MRRGAGTGLNDWRMEIYDWRTLATDIEFQHGDDTRDHDESRPAQSWDAGIANGAVTKAKSANGFKNYSCCGEVVVILNYFQLL